MSISPTKYVLLIATTTAACVLAGLTILAWVEAGQLIDHTTRKIRATEHRLQELEETKPINPA